VPCKLPSYNVPVPFDGLSDARYYRGSTSVKPPTSEGFWARSAMHVATLQHASLLVFRMPHCRILLYFFGLTLGSNCVTSIVLTSIEVWSAWLCNKCLIALSPQLVKISRPKPHKLNINASPNFKRIWRRTCFLTQNQILVIDYILTVNPHLLSLCWIG